MRSNATRCIGFSLHHASHAASLSGATVPRSSSAAHSAARRTMSGVGAMRVVVLPIRIRNCVAALVGLRDIALYRAHGHSERCRRFIVAQAFDASEQERLANLWRQFPKKMQEPVQKLGGFRYPL